MRVRSLVCVFLLMFFSEMRNDDSMTEVGSVVTAAVSMTTSRLTVRTIPDEE